jgi:hypothetical protein
MGALTVLVLCCSAALAAGGEDARRETLSLNERFDDVYLMRRIGAYREIGGLTSEQTLEEFAFVERLLERALDNGRIPGERREALRAVVHLAINRMVDPLKAMEALHNLITSADTPVGVRVDAMKLLREFGAVDAGNRVDLQEVLRRIQELVGRIAQEQTDIEDNPLPLRMAAIRTLGAMSPEQAGPIFVTILRRSEDEPRVRLAAVEGLRYFVRNQRVVDRGLLERIAQILAESPGPANLQVRLAALATIEVLLQNGTEPRDTGDLFQLLGARFSEGVDRELIASSRCLLRLDDPEYLRRILRLHIQELRQGERTGEAREALFMGLVEFFSPLGRLVGDDDERLSVRRGALQSASEIVTFLLALAEEPKAPTDMRLMAVRGLGLVPPSLDRRPVVKRLIVLLGDEVEGGANALVGEIRTSLSQLTDAGPFVDEEGTPQVETWRRWFNAHLERLAPPDID